MRDFHEMLRRGTRTEARFDGECRRAGFTTLWIAQASPAGSASSRPVPLMTPDGPVAAADFLVFDGARRYWVDVKEKSAPSWSLRRRFWSHIVNADHLTSALRSQRDTAVPVVFVLYVVHAPFEDGTTGAEVTTHCDPTPRWMAAAAVEVAAAAFYSPRYHDGRGGFVFEESTLEPLPVNSRALDWKRWLQRAHDRAGGKAQAARALDALEVMSGRDGGAHA